MPEPTDKAIRAWCCEMQWPGRKAFVFGTVFHEVGQDQQNVVEEALRLKFLSGIAEILPLNVPPPAILRLMPGAIFFVPEGDF